MNSASVAVIGAGLAGLACARRLRLAGVPLRMFEAQRAFLAFKGLAEERLSLCKIPLS